MVKGQKRGEMIRQFILENISQHSGDISKLTREKFSITRQAVNLHVQRLVKEGKVVVSGTKRQPHYAIRQAQQASQPAYPQQQPIN